ncbi:hypothetical protein [Phaeacidiphilus oryzae]|uniref:hypothetical protein n=1 Tax=Phaeacidiphilus oryzae TaxID=348818 RepID=UPI0005690CDF|nr:hypothetical protein [Phaeacidiphilus oryzae]
MSMLLSLVAAVLLLVPTAAVLVGVAVSGRRDRAWARSVAEVLAEFRAHAAARAAGPPEDGPGGARAARTVRARRPRRRRNRRRPGWHR